VARVISLWRNLVRRHRVERDLHRVSYLVARRRVEIGVRAALGAEPRTVVGMIVAETGAQLALGLAIGLSLAAIASRSAASLLYGLKPLDQMSFAAGTGVLTCVALLAVWVPARRASRVAPTIAPRE
jgi:ABC-type antimicrobial peptide transport system permease subunit